jgi:DNA-binding transcriptional ArsR family regulator
MAEDRLSGIFAALADPTRRTILARLLPGELAVTELARPFEMSLPAVTKHLKVLESAGLIARGRSAQWRPCRLEAAPLQEAMRWLDDYQLPGKMRQRRSRRRG